METIYEFSLPKGYIDASGEVHKRGKMRLATAGDEISATRDPRVLANPSYLTIVILSKVVTELEGLDAVTATTIEKLFTADLAYLQDMYQRINDMLLLCGFSTLDPRVPFDWLILYCICVPDIFEADARMKEIFREMYGERA